MSKTHSAQDIAKAITPKGYLQFISSKDEDLKVISLAFWANTNFAGREFVCHINDIGKIIHIEYISKSNEHMSKIVSVGDYIDINSLISKKTSHEFITGRYLSNDKYIIDGFIEDGKINKFSKDNLEYFLRKYKEDHDYINDYLLNIIDWLKSREYKLESYELADDKILRYLAYKREDVSITLSPDYYDGLSLSITKEGFYKRVRLKNSNVQYFDNLLNDMMKNKFSIKSGFHLVMDEYFIENYSLKDMKDNKASVSVKFNKYDKKHMLVLDFNKNTVECQTKYGNAKRIPEYLLDIQTAMKTFSKL